MRRYWRKTEPLKPKLKRWIFGDKNLVPSTVSEQFIDYKVEQSKPKLALIINFLYRISHGNPNL